MDKADEWMLLYWRLCDAVSLTERQRLPVADVPNAIFIAFGNSTRKRRWKLQLH